MKYGGRLKALFVCSLVVIVLIALDNVLTIVLGYSSYLEVLGNRNKI